MSGVGGELFVTDFTVTAICYFSVKQPGDSAANCTQVLQVLFAYFAPQTHTGTAAGSGLC